ncbi:hypothetical protein LEP1GSC161_1671 [Leptospira santarosai str. CBC1416]|uniref:Uncharacterized protein n=1 Tax=Leptospira santarosai str. CBC1416 TaxID=1193059 RepID=M6VLF3_9LEPT|nr:hypothetical protein LEP1GSC161_1671 [Leptospira santarosai str. CBC1416]
MLCKEPTLPLRGFWLSHSLSADPREAFAEFGRSSLLCKEPTLPLRGFWLSHSLSADP